MKNLIEKTDKKVTEQPDLIYKEIHEQQIRKRNIIIFNLPE